MSFSPYFVSKLHSPNSRTVAFLELWFQETKESFDAVANSMVLCQLLESIAARLVKWQNPFPCWQGIQLLLYKQAYRKQSWHRRQMFSCHYFSDRLLLALSAVRREPVTSFTTFIASEFCNGRFLPFISHTECFGPFTS